MALSDVISFLLFRTSTINGISISQKKVCIFDGFKKNKSIIKTFDRTSKERNYAFYRTLLNCVHLSRKIFQNPLFRVTFKKYIL